MKIFLLLYLLLWTMASYTQQNTTSIKGKLVDSLTGQPLYLATISVFSADDTSLVTYRMSNEHGDFKITRLPENKALRLLITFSGYAVYRKLFSLAKEEVKDFSTIGLLPDAKSLEEVLVTAERPPVIIRNDTIEFNASSFRTLPNALVEDLLRKMPGIEIDKQGNIMANGRIVNRILIDGKSFFGNNIAMATRNLPADVIDKVQVMEDKEEIDRNINGDLTRTGQVINLTLKKNIRKGWFGKLYAGLGTNDRYEAGGIASIYRDTLQLSLVAFTNNVSRSGFSFNEVQDIGGFNRSGISTMATNQRAGIGGFAVNGLSFGGTENGISRTTGGGFNLNHAPTKNKSFFIQYLTGTINNSLDEKRNINEYINDTVIQTFSLLQNRKSASTHNIGAGTNIKIDNNTDFSFRTGFSHLAANENGSIQLLLSNNKSGPISKGSGDKFSKPLERAYIHNLFLTHRFLKKGNVLNISNYLVMRTTRQPGITEMTNEYFTPSYQTRQFNQLAQTDTRSLLTNLNTNYTGVLSPSWTFRANSYFEYNYENRGLHFFDKQGADYNQLNEAKSGLVSRKQYRVNPSLSLSYRRKELMIMASVSGLSLSILNSYGSKLPVDRKHITAILPEILMTRKRLSLQYAVSLSLPSIIYQVPVADSSNPFQIVYGNPDLNPVKRHSFRLNNSVYITSSRINYNYYLNLIFLNNDVILSRRIASDGVQTILPVNASGSIGFDGGAGIGKEYKRKDIQINLRIQANIGIERKKLLVNDNLGAVTSYQFSPSASMTLNWKDMLEFKPRYSTIISRTDYTDQYFRNLQVFTHLLENEIILRFPKNIVWETNALYRYNNEVSTGIPQSAIYWNAGVTLLLFPRQTGMLRFHAYDLFDSNNGVTRTARQNQVIDMQTNVLGRYAEITFIYNIRNFSAGKAGGKEQLLKL